MTLHALQRCPTRFIRKTLCGLIGHDTQYSRRRITTRAGKKFVIARSGQPTCKRCLTVIKRRGT